MVDCFEPAFRSELMARIRSSGTAPEERLALAIREILGHRWRIDRNESQMHGRPDVVVPGLKLCIFADGCFFHRCERHSRLPKSRLEYWGPKLDGNRRRDKRNAARLRADGWAVWRFWEHDLRPKALPSTTEILRRRLESRIERTRRPSA